MNYGASWYEFNFTKVYPKMTNFNNPNEMPKEQLFFTYDEFKQFISVEKDIRWICGLRRSELRGLQRKDIDLNRRTISITKQITDRNESIKNIRFSLPKTQSSIRTLKISQRLTDDLKTMKNELKNDKNFNENYFVAGDMFPVATNTITNHKKRCLIIGIFSKLFSTK